jgi:hypothetical protein
MELHAIKILIVSLVTAIKTSLHLSAQHKVVAQMMLHCINAKDTPVLLVMIVGMDFAIATQRFVHSLHVIIQLCIHTVMANIVQIIVTVIMEIVI